MKIVNGNLFIDGTFHKNLEVRFDNEKILEIGENLIDDEVIDAKGNDVYAGLVETHMHGGFGQSFVKSMYDDLIPYKGVESVRIISENLVKHGVTSYLPTITSYPKDDMLEAVRNIRIARKDIKGADPFAIHFEGPYHARTQHSAGNSAFFRDPSPEDTLYFVDNDLSDIKLVCIAPEVEGAMEYISWATSNNVKTEICYTSANCAQVKEACDRGLDQSSHFFNGFKAMHHRDDGPVPAVLLEDRIKIQMTMDGFHVVPAWVKAAIKIKGIKNVYGMTDMIELSGLPEGEYGNELHKKIFVKGNKIISESGTIQGGNTTFEKMMYQARNVIGLTKEEVGLIYAENPCQCLEINDRGKIEVNRRSDFTIMNDNYDVIKTIVKGEVCYENY